MSALALSCVEKRTREFFLSLLPVLIKDHFGCKLSSCLTPEEQYSALTRFSLSRVVPLKRSQGPIFFNTEQAFGFSVSGDLEKILRADQAVLHLWHRTKETDSLPGHTNEIKGTDISKDGTWAITKSDDEVIIWDLKRKILLNTLRQERLLDAKNIYIIPGCEKKILLTFDDEMEIWDLNKCLATIKLAKTFTCDPMISQDGKTVLITQDDGNLLHYSLVDGKILNILSIEKNFYCSALNAKGTHAYVANLDRIKIWDLASARLLGQIDLQRQTINGLQVSADEKKLITINNEGDVCVWHLPEGTLSCTFKNRIIVWDCLKISDDGAQLLVTNNSDTVMFFDLFKNDKNSRFLATPAPLKAKRSLSELTPNTNLKKTKLV
jgi:WD40 repeat protein